MSVKKRNVNAMPLDAEQLIAENEVVAASGAVGNVIDLKGYGYGKGSLVLDVIASDDANGDETYSVALELSDDLAFTVPVLALSVDLPRGDLGRRIQEFSNQIGDTMYRYARVNVTVGGTSPSVTLTAFISEVVKNGMM